VGGARYAVYLSDTVRARVAGNRAEGSSHGFRLDRGERGAVLDNRIERGGFGLTVGSHSGLRAAGNRVEDIAGWGFGGAMLSGTTTVASNRFRSCGHGSPAGGVAMAVAALADFGELVIESCEVVDTGISLDQTKVVQPAFGITALLVASCRIEGNLVSLSNPLLARDPAAEDRALLLMGLLELQLTDVVVFGGSARILGNTLIGTGATSLVQLLQVAISQVVRVRFESVIFADNRCEHWVTEPREAAGTVSLRGRSAIVHGNRITSTVGKGISSVRFNGVPGPFVANHTSGGSDRAAPAQFPSPESAFNL